MNFFYHPIVAQVSNAVENAEPAAENTDAPITDAEVEAVVEGASKLQEFFQTGALGLLIEGGIFMVPILILGILALAVIIERWRSLKMLNIDSSTLRETVLEHLTKDEVEDALNYCDRQTGPVAAILSNGLRKYLVLRRLEYNPGRIEGQVTQSMENYAVHIVAALERHLPVLAIVSSVAPMVGFLGTVQGMIVAFRDIQEKMGEVNIVEAAAAGIEVALLTTCFGLIIGIPAFIAYNYFSSVINGFVLEVEETATELMEVVTLQVTLEGKETA